MKIQSKIKIPDVLSHYYESAIGPFVNLSDLPFHEANKILQSIRGEKITFASDRSEDYLHISRELEEME